MTGKIITPGVYAMPFHVDRVCEFCGAGFTTKRSNVSRGNGRYCSKSCARTQVRGASIDRFSALYIPEPNSGCWLWIGALGRPGYGSFCISKTPTRAHRASWLLHNGTIPEGQFVLHKCDVPACVNPEHLFLGTGLDNVRDCISKGRAALRRGEANGNSKLTEEDVKTIRASKLTAAAIAQDYEVSAVLIHKIRQRRIWEHIV